MKFALLSDIHSNVFALQAVIADIKKHNVDFIVNLGDILYGPIAPKATFDLLMSHEITTICGNQDRQIYQATAEEIAVNPTMQFILDDLDNTALQWMKSLPFDMQLNSEIYLCHGTPNDDLTYLLEDISLGYSRLRPDHEIIKFLNGQRSKLICCGHTHIPRCVYLTTGQLVINPGSVGLQAYSDDLPVLHSMENFNPMASYSIIEKQGSDWAVKHIKVPYPVDLAINECRKRDRADWVHFLKTGRVASLSSV